MSIRFSEDIVPLGDLKKNPGRVVRHAAEAGRPVLLTSRGRGVAVVRVVAVCDSRFDPFILLIGIDTLEISALSDAITGKAA